MNHCSALSARSTYLSPRSLSTAGTEFLFQNPRGWRNVCALFELAENARREVFYCKKLFPISEITAPVPVIHNAICEILGDSGKLGQLFYCRGVDTDSGSHPALDVPFALEVLPTLRGE